MLVRMLATFYFFFNDTATTEIYTLSLHDALPISSRKVSLRLRVTRIFFCATRFQAASFHRLAQLWVHAPAARSEEHTSELQSQSNLVCRLLLEKKKSRLSRLKSMIQYIHLCPPPR